MEETIFILTGAGASQDSGIQTYRGENGYYESAANIEADLHVSNLSQSEKIWKRLLPLYKQIIEHEPGPTYKKLQDLISKSKECMLVTQNVDGYSHCLKGVEVIELHGTCKTMSCISCMKKVEITKEFIENFEESKCECGGIIRPDIVLFGEELNSYLTTKIFTFIKKKRPTKIFFTLDKYIFYIRQIYFYIRQIYFLH